LFANEMNNKEQLVISLSAAFQVKIPNILK